VTLIHLQQTTFFAAFAPSEKEDIRHGVCQCTAENEQLAVKLSLSRSIFVDGFSNKTSLLWI